MKLSGRGRMNDGTFGTTNRILNADNSQQPAILSVVSDNSLTEVACGEQNPQQHPRKDSSRHDFRPAAGGGGHEERLLKETFCNPNEQKGGPCSLYPIAG